jgi:hypothetical protein
VSRAHPTRTTGADVALAIVIAIVLAAAVVHWIELEGVTSTPAHAAGLLALPGQWLRRYWAWMVHHVRLDTDRRQLKWIEEEIQHMESELAFLPQHIRYLRGEAARMRVCIAVAERQGPQLPPAQTEPQP